MIRLILIATVSFLSVTLKAQEAPISSFGGESGFNANLGFFYFFDDRKQADTANSNQMTYDLRLGYTFPSSVFVGFLYVGESETRKYTSVATPSNNRNETHDRSHMGLYVGYEYGMSYVSLAYVFGAKWDAKDNGATTSYSDSQGIQLDFGLEFSIGSSMFIGPRLSYKNISYTKSESGGASSNLSPALNRTSLDPIFNFGYKF